MPEDHFVETTLNVRKVGVWAALSSCFLIGPYFFEGNMNGDIYRNFLDRFHRELENVFPDEMDSIWFQQDGATPHTAGLSREKCRSFFGNNLVGKHLTNNWPPRSPDITLMDFFLWGVIKERTFSEPRPTSIGELKNKIVEAFDSLRSETSTMTRAWDCLLYRLNLMIQKRGKHIEKTVKLKNPNILI